MKPKEILNEGTFYHYYLHNNKECNPIVFEANNQKEKDIMEAELIYNIYPYNSACNRDKWVNGEKEYSGIFLLKDRRENPNFISLYKKLNDKQQSKRIAK